MYKTRVVREEDGFFALEEDWNKLLRATGNTNIFLTFDWLATWWKHFKKHGDRLYVVTLERDGGGIAIAPLFIRQGMFASTLQFLGRPGSDYSDFVVLHGEERCIRHLVRGLFATAECDRIDLSGITEDSPSFKVLSESWHDQCFLVRRIFLYPAPYLRIEATWDEYQQGLRKKLRQDTARQMRHLQKIGAPCFEQCRNGQEVTGYVAELIRQKRSRSQQTGGPDIFQDNRWVSFYHEVTERFLEKGWLDLSRFHLNGLDLALHLGFVYQKRFFFYAPSFSKEFERFSVGRILLHHLIERSHKEKLYEFDFLAGAEDYKYLWTSTERDIYQFSAYKRNIEGLLLREFYEHLLPFLRSSNAARRFMRWQRQRVRVYGLLKNLLR